MKQPGWGDRIRSHRLCRQAQREPDRERALRLLEKAAQASGPDGRPLLARARLEFEQGELEAAQKTLKRAEKRDPRNPACFLLKGQVLYAAKQYAAAQSAFEQALQLDARNGLAKNFLAFCHLQQNRLEEFRRLLSEEGLWHRPDLVRIAWVQRKLPVWKLHQEALRERDGRQKEAKPLAPVPETRSARARLAFARKALRKGCPVAAYEAMLPMAEERKADAKYVYLFAEAAVRARRTDIARPILENRLKALESKKKVEDPYLFFLLGQCCFWSGDYAASVEYYTRGERHTTMPFYSALFEYYAALSWLVGEDERRAGEAIEKACRTDSLLASLIAVSLTDLFCKGMSLRELIDEE